jgi:hypothetical protein
MNREAEGRLVRRAAALAVGLAGGLGTTASAYADSIVWPFNTIDHVVLLQPKTWLWGVGLGAEALGVALVFVVAGIVLLVRVARQSASDVPQVMGDEG